MGNITEVIRKIANGDIEKLDKKMLEALKGYSGKRTEIRHRLTELDDEMDIERAFQRNAAILVLAGLALGIRDRRFTIVSGVAGAFLLQHAISGWCPPIELLKAAGYRSRQEIEREKVALKALRGDFKHVDSARKAWEKSE